jgi:hypothetical protein
MQPANYPLQGPTVGACVVGGAHFFVFWVWLGFRLQTTYEGHSGYSFVGSPLDKVPT